MKSIRHHRVGAREYPPSICMDRRMSTQEKRCSANMFGVKKIKYAIGRLSVRCLA